MVKLNIASVNMVFRKGYLLAGVIMAANMFVVNEMKAMRNIEENDKEKENNEKIIDLDNAEMINPEKKDEGKKTISLENVLYYVEWVSCHILSYENTINLIGGAVLSGINNYLKWWDYNPRRYSKLRIGCLGWRSKRFFMDYLQIDINLNLGRGILWLIAGACIFFIKGISNEGKDSENYEDYLQPLHFSFLVASNLSEKESMQTIALILSFLFQGFVSVPLAIHISNFSISISLDSMLWAGIGKILELKVKEDEGKEEKGKEEKTLKNIEELNDQYQQNNGYNTFEKGEGTELKDMDQNKNNNQNLNDEEESNNNEEQEEKDENIND